MTTDEIGRQFHEALARLQALHEAHVNSLAAEVVRLRSEPKADRPPLETPPLPQQADAPRLGPPPIHFSPGGPSDSPSPARSQRLRSEVLQSQRASCASQCAPAPSSRIRRVSCASQFAPSSRVSMVSRTSQAAMMRRIRRRTTTVWEPPESGWKGTCARFVQRKTFDLAIGCVIAVNAFCIGIESSMARAGRETPVALNVMEYFFIAVYMVELAMRLVVKGIKELTKNHWIQFELILVICGILHMASTLVTTNSIGLLEKMLLVRILSLARLARVFRLMTKFNTLWLLVQGLVNSIVALLSTCAIIFILLYVFAVMGLDLLHPDSQASERYTQIVDSNFDNLFTAMLTLLQGLTLDNFSTIYKPIVVERPYLVLYFIPFMLTVPIALMNLVTAVMVNLSLDQATKDKLAQEQVQAQKREELVDLLKDAFVDLDTDCSGQVDLTEMLRAPDDVKSLIFEIADFGRPQNERAQDLREIFHILDFDGKGYVEICEFCDGLLKLHDHTSLDTLRFRRLCQSSMDSLTNLFYSSSNSCSFSDEESGVGLATTPPTMPVGRSEAAMHAGSTVAPLGGDDRRHTQQL